MIQGATFWLTVLVSVAGFWSLPRRYRLWFLTLVSLAYLSYLDWKSTAALTGWSCLFYWLSAKAGREGWRRFVLPGLILAIVGYLMCFKYIPPLLAAFGTTEMSRRFIIPLGISFFTFKLMHYAVEVARGNVTNFTPDKFFCYIFLFPIFTAGPIERFDHFLNERDERLRLQHLTEGGQRVIVGLIKKFILADMFVPLLWGELTIDGVLSGASSGGAPAVWNYVIVAYLYAYLDFSAYSDIAIGLSRLFGIRIMENFNWPILAPNISDFWKRWHMTLAGWCQAYVYMPIIGLTRNPYLALYLSFSVMGLWHAGSLNWLLWGWYHATGLSLYLTWVRYKRKRGWMKPPRLPGRALGIVMTTLFVSSAYIFPMTHNVAGPYEAIRLWARLFMIELPAW